MATLLDLFNDYNGQNDLDVLPGGQTLLTGQPITDSTNQIRAIDMNAHCKRNATNGVHDGFVKYAGPSYSNPIIVDCEKSILKLDGSGVHARIMLKNFRFVNGRVWVACQDVWEWYCEHRWKWNDWGLARILNQKQAVVNITNVAGGQANVMRVSGDTFATADAYQVDVVTKGFVRIYGGGTLDGDVAQNMLYARLQSVSDSTHAVIKVVAGSENPIVAGNNLVMEWGSYPEKGGTIAPRVFDREGSTNHRLMGCRLGDGSTTTTGRNAKNHLIDGCLYDASIDPINDLWVPAVSGNGGHSGNPDVHNESISAYGGNTGAIKNSRFKGSLTEGGHERDVRVIYKPYPGAQYGVWEPFDLTVDNCDFHDGVNQGGWLQLNDSSTGFNAATGPCKMRIGNLRFFTANPSLYAGGFVLHSQVNFNSGQPKGNENITANNLPGRFEITKLSNPMGTYGGTIDPATYRDVQWKNTWQNGEEDAYLGWGTGAPPLFPPSVPRNIVLTPGDHQIVISWDPPLSDGGSPISRYETVFAPADTNGSSSRTAPANATSLTVDSLVNGQTYGFYFYAVNAMGNGDIGGGTAAPDGGVILPPLGDQGDLYVGAVVEETAPPAPSIPYPSNTLYPDDTLYPNE